MTTTSCPFRGLLINYLANQPIQLEEQLEFFEHVDHCQLCWETIYQYRKAQHPQFYKSLSARSKRQDNIEDYYQQVAAIGSHIRY